MILENLNLFDDQKYLIPVTASFCGLLMAYNSPVFDVLKPESENTLYNSVISVSEGMNVSSKF